MGKKKRKKTSYKKNKINIFILFFFVIIILCEQGLEFILKKGSQSIDLKKIQEVYKKKPF